MSKGSEVSASKTVAIFSLLAVALLGAQTALADLASDISCGNSNHQTLRSNLGDASAAADGVSSKISASQSAFVIVAAIYGADNRRVPSGADYPWRAYGTMAAPGFGNSCTVALVGACHAITVGHCVVDQSKDGSMVPKFAKDKVPEFVSANGTTRAKLETYSAGHGDYDKDLQKDVAFIKFDRPVGKELGWLGVADKTADDLAGPKVFGYGYGQNGYVLAGFNGDVQNGNVLSVDDNVTILKSKDDLIQFRGNSFDRGSGAPIVRLNSKGEPEIVGVSTRAITAPTGIGNIKKQVQLPADETTRLATGIASHAFAQDLLKFIRDNPCAPGTSAEK